MSETRVVPVEPTEEMIQAGIDAYYDAGSNGMREIYKAMLSAAPSVEPTTNAASDEPGATQHGAVAESKARDSSASEHGSRDRGVAPTLPHAAPDTAASDETPRTRALIDAYINDKDDAAFAKLETGIGQLERDLKEAQIQRDEERRIAQRAVLDMQKAEARARTYGQQLTASVEAHQSVEAEARKLREALERIQQWDCLNPPSVLICSDFLWLKTLVDAALTEAGKEDKRAD